MAYNKIVMNEYVNYLTRTIIYINKFVIKYYDSNAKTIQFSILTCIINVLIIVLQYTLNNLLIDVC